MGLLSASAYSPSGYSTGNALLTGQLPTMVSVPFHPVLHRLCKRPVRTFGNLLRAHDRRCWREDFCVNLLDGRPCRTGILLIAHPIKTA